VLRGDLRIDVRDPPLYYSAIKSLVFRVEDIELLAIAFIGSSTSRVLLGRAKTPTQRSAIE
jgi:hypothetical protein